MSTVMATLKEYRVIKDYTTEDGKRTYRKGTAGMMRGERLEELLKAKVIKPVYVVDDKDLEEMVKPQEEEPKKRKVRPSAPPRRLKILRGARPKKNINQIRNT